MLPQATVRFEAFCGEIQKFSRAAREMRPEKLDEFVTGIRIDPNTILQTNHSGSLEEDTQSLAYAPPSFPDIEDHDPPFSIPEGSFRNPVISKKDLFQF